MTLGFAAAGFAGSYPNGATAKGFRGGALMMNDVGGVREFLKLNFSMIIEKEERD